MDVVKRMVDGKMNGDTDGMGRKYKGDPEGRKEGRKAGGRRKERGMGMEETRKGGKREGGKRGVAG